MKARIAGLALAACLGACAMPAPRPLPELAGVPAAFEMSGRLALRSGDRSDIARLRWTHRPGADLWIVASPLGNEVARIESDANGAVLSQGGGEQQEAPSFAALTERILGVPLDPAQLAKWLHGAAPEAASGWTVTIEERQRAGTVDMARRMSARRGETTVRLVVDEYRPIAE